MPNIREPIRTPSKPPPYHNDASKPGGMPPTSLPVIAFVLNSEILNISLSNPNILLGIKCSGATKKMMKQIWFDVFADGGQQRMRGMTELF